MAKKKDFDGDYDASVKGEVEAREDGKPDKDMKSARKQKESTSKGFLKHTQKGTC